MSDNDSPFGGFIEQITKNVENVKAYIAHVQEMQEAKDAEEGQKYKQFQGKIPLIKQEDFMTDSVEPSAIEGPNYIYDNPDAPKIDVEGMIEKLLSDGL